MVTARAYSTLVFMILLAIAASACGTATTPAAFSTALPSPEASALPATAQSTATLVPLVAPTGTPNGPAGTSVAATPAPTPNAQGAALSFNFDSDAPGGLPSGVVSFSGAWSVRAEPDAPSPPNALCQTGTATFPALALTAQKLADVAVSVRFKPISGRTDQAAGIIFRIQDKDNYYIVRANALEANVNIYKYVNGQRIDIKDGSGKVVSGQWQELRVEVTGNRIRGFLEGQLVVETTDDTYKAGTVGLWTKADSVTCFDNVQIAAR